MHEIRKEIINLGSQLQGMHKAMVYISTLMESQMKKNEELEG